MNTEIEAVLFDLEDTLVNSAQNYYAHFRDSWTETFRAFGITPQSEIKNLAELDRLIRSSSNQIHEVYRYQSNFLFSRMQWMQGAQETLEKLRGKVRLGIVTNADVEIFTKIGHIIEIPYYFDSIVTAREVQVKPSPEGLFKAAAELFCVPENCLYVGDRHTDVQAAQRAKMESCLLSGHYHHSEAYNKHNGLKQQPLEEEPMYRIEKLSELLRILGI